MPLPMGIFCRCHLMAIVLCGSIVANAEDLLPADTEIASSIDHYIQQHLVASGVAAVEPADDLTLLRRTTLDLAGRVPTSVEQDWFMSQPASDRRRLLVDRLMQSTDFDFHQRNWLDRSDVATTEPRQHRDQGRRGLLATHRQTVGQ